MFQIVLKDWDSIRFGRLINKQTHLFSRKYEGDTDTKKKKKYKRKRNLTLELLN